MTTKNTYQRKSKQKPSQGLGDKIAKITKATGIEAAVKFVAGEDCGCEERKQKLNVLFPRKQPLCMNQMEFEWWSNFREQQATEITSNEANHISQIWSRLFQARQLYHPCHCNPREWQRMINEINFIFETY